MNQNQVQPEVLSSIALLNVGGQPYIEYNVNGMRDAFALSWEQITQLQNKWREELFFLRGEREKAVAEREKEEAQEQAVNGSKTDEEPEPIAEVGGDEVKASEGADTVKEGCTDCDSCGDCGRTPKFVIGDDAE